MAGKKRQMEDVIDDKLEEGEGKIKPALTACSSLHLVSQASKKLKVEEEQNDKEKGEIEGEINLALPTCSNHNLVTQNSTEFKEGEEKEGKDKELQKCCILNELEDKRAEGQGEDSTEEKTSLTDQAQDGSDNNQDAAEALAVRGPMEDVLLRIRQAIEKNSFEELATILSKESISRDKLIPLFFHALHQGQAKCVESIIRAGFKPSLNLETEPKTGLFPVLWALGNQDQYVLRSLVSHPEEVEALEQHEGLTNPTILCMFVLRNDVPMTEVLLQSGFHPNNGNLFPLITSEDYPARRPNVPQHNPFGPPFNAFFPMHNPFHPPHNHNPFHPPHNQNQFHVPHNQDNDETSSDEEPDQPDYPDSDEMQSDEEPFQPNYPINNANNIVIIPNDEPILADAPVHNAHNDEIFPEDEPFQPDYPDSDEMQSDEEPFQPGFPMNNANNIEIIPNNEPVLADAPVHNANNAAILADDEPVQPEGPVHNANGNEILPDDEPVQPDVPVHNANDDGPVQPDVPVHNANDDEPLPEKVQQLKTVRKQKRMNIYSRKKDYSEGKIVPAMFPLIEACRSPDRLEMAKLLLKYNADPNIADSVLKETPLIAAARSGSVDLVQLLLDAGAKTEAKDIQNRTALYQACSYDHIDVVKLLLQAGADPEGYRAPPRNGRYQPRKRSIFSPMSACMKNPPKMEIAKLLTKQGVDLNYDSLLHYAVADGLGVEFVRFLLESGADPNSGTSSAASVLHYIAERYVGDCEAVIDLLMEYGANINKFGKAGEPNRGLMPTMVATMKKRPYTLYYFLQHNSHLKRARHKWVIVNKAIEASDPVILVLLAAAGANMAAFKHRWEADKIPKRILARKDCMAYLMEEMKPPLSLKQIARSAIRKYIKRLPFKKSVMEIQDCPHSLKEYILFKDLTQFLDPRLKPEKLWNESVRFAHSPAWSGSVSESSCFF